LAEHDDLLSDPLAGYPEAEDMRAANRPKPSKKKRSFPGSELLTGTPEEILQRIFDGDPLGLMPRIEERVRKFAILIDEPRIYSATTARIAFDARYFDAATDVIDCFDHCINLAVRRLIERDAEEEKRGIPPAEPFDPYWIAMSKMLGIEPPLARRAIQVFHSLPFLTRRTFYALTIEGKSLNRWVAEGNGSPEEVRDRLQYTLIMISTLGKCGLAGPDRASGRKEEFDD